MEAYCRATLSPPCMAVSHSLGSRPRGCSAHRYPAHRRHLERGGESRGAECRVRQRQQHCPVRGR